MRDAAAVSSSIRRAYEQFLAGGAVPETVRSVVRDSWARSLERGVDPGAGGTSPLEMSDEEFARYREAHPITAVRPVVQSLMLDDIADSGVVLALTDNVGRLLWVEGESSARDRASRINFVEGSVWSEEVVGTNAPGLALATGKSVQVVGPEHFSSPVQEWSCAAAPVHDPATGHVIGVIDVTGGREVAAPFALAAVRSVVAVVERELKARAVDLSQASTFDTGSQARLTVLADNSYRWQRGVGAPGGRALSRRHAEILLLLQHYPEGLNTEQLALMLADDGVDPVTVRAEISRLRRDLGNDVIESRPYRLTVELSSDVGDLREQIANHGDLVPVIEAIGRGGLLVESNAPGISEIFEELREDVRSRVIAEGQVAALRAWTSSVHGRDDLAAWRRLEHRLPVGHPDRALVGGRIRILDRRYGV
ncbi:helix-turn-helix domain-containing protein [Gordonia aichiensis]|uniref:helix-turn-helix domain-containing protein n=1 Tax=Gordonia aichiensis TaxID=36820 RepID=UPI000348F86A|nr:helix-turn-helix domain-containing protein [Gordonia aichiensis]